MKPPKLLVVGTGALASLLAGRLARSGARVSMAGSWEAGLEALSIHGLQVDDAPSLRIEARSIQDLPPDFDAALVAVKAYRTAEVAAATARATRGVVLTLQNGLGNREVLEAACGPRVAVGVATCGATLQAPGRIVTFPGAITLGREPATAAGVDLLAPRLEAELAPDVERLVWRKLAVNCSINPLTALHRVCNGALLEEPRRSELAALAREVGEVAAARGLDLGTEVVELALEVARRTAGNRSSMLQDVERGAPTEIDALCGAVVRAGGRLGVPAPANARMLAALTPAVAA